DNEKKMVSGYAGLELQSDDEMLSGFSIVAYRHATEAIMPISSPASSFVLPVDLDRDFRTAVVITNPSRKSATVSFSFPETGEQGSFDIPAQQQVSAFVDDSPFKIHPFKGTSSAVFKSSVPVAVAAIVTSKTKESEFRMAAVPSVNPSAPPE